MQTGDDEYTESICRPRYHTYKGSVRSETYTGAAFVTYEKLPTCRVQTSIDLYGCNIQAKKAAYGTLSRRVISSLLSRQLDTLLHW